MSACPCITEPLHRRTVGPDVEVLWTDTEGCPCPPDARVSRWIEGADQAVAASVDLRVAAGLMRRLEDTAPGSPERAAIHDERPCENHRCTQEAI